MKKLTLLIAAAGLTLLGAETRTFTGVITDTMCKANHEPMHMKPHSKCVRECVKMDPSKWKYALYDGKNVYVLSDQKTPAEYADQKVKVTGKLDESSKTIQVEKIEPVK